MIFRTIMNKKEFFYRKKLLLNLITCEKDLNFLEKELNKFSTDECDTLVVLHAKDLEFVLNKFYSGILSIDDIERWADLVELRDGIDFEDEEIQTIIFELANPLINGKLTKKRLKEIMDFLISRRL